MAVFLFPHKIGDDNPGQDAEVWRWNRNDKWRETENKTVSLLCLVYYLQNFIFLVG